MSGYFRLGMSMLVAMIPLLCVGPQDVSATDKPCYWLDTSRELGLNDQEILPALGCRRITGGDWVTGTILATDQYIRHSPRKYDKYIEEAVPFIQDEVEAMLIDPRLKRVIEYDVATGEFRVGPDFTQGSRGRLVQLEGEPLFGSGDEMIYSSYEERAYKYLTAPGNEILAEYVLWYAQWRDNAVSLIVDLSYLNPVANSSLQSKGEYNQMPWPWQLADENAIAEFTIWAVDTHGV